MGGPPFFCALVLVGRGWGCWCFAGCCCFATKRFAYWAQNCVWGLREGMTVLSAVCCGGNASGRIVVLGWVYVGAICRMEPCAHWL